MCFACVAILSGHCFPLEWPTSGRNVRTLFGGRSNGVIERGLVVGGEETIRSAGHGTILITIESQQNMSGFPSALGNAVVVSNEDQLLTVYGNLEDLNRMSERKTVETGDILSNVGKSAWGEPGSVIFQVIDREKKNYINPLLLLPALEDKKGPVIRDVTIVSPSGQTIALGSAKTARQGKYRIYADIADSIEGSSAELVPFRVSVLVNGKEETSLPFEVLREQQGKLFLNEPDFSWQGLYGDPTRMYLGAIALNRGRSDISVIARDIAGNERSVLFGLLIE